MAKSVRRAENAIGYRFSDPHILWEALCGPGCQCPPGITPDGNRRLASLGDSILRFVLLTDWYESGDHRVRGFQALSRVGSNAYLGSIGRAHGFEAFVFNYPAPKLSKADSNAIASTVEAVVVAAYLDGGIDAARRVLTKLGLTFAKAPK